MPPHCAPTLRKKTHASVLKEGAEPENGNVLEYALGFLALANNIAFTVASVFFYSFMGEEYTKRGDWIFIIGSVVGLAMCWYHVHEVRAHIAHMKGSLFPGMATMQGRRLRNEFMENLFFTLATALFLAGSVLFMPGLFENKEQEHRALRRGAILFVVASLCMVFATFFAAIEMASDPEHQSMPPGSPKLYCHLLHVLGLASAIFGGVFFAMGSALYRPVFEKAGSGVAADEGTTFYLVGSVLFTLESVLSLAVSYNKAKYEGQFEDALWRRDPKLDGAEEGETTPLLAAKSASGAGRNE